MSKSILSIAIVLMLFANCTDKEAASIDTNVIDIHNSQNSLDWAGEYHGTLPCTDCEGIKTTINLAEDGSFTRESIYLGKNSEPFVEEGKFTWTDNGSRIELTRSEASAGKYQVGENRLIQLDLEGKPIKGSLAERYILNKNN